jgi:hypothetical protein
LDDGQKNIDALKKQIAELKKTLDNPEARALSDKYNEIQQELDSIKAEQDSAFKNLNSLRDERTKLQQDQQAKFTAIRELKDTYYKERKAYKEHEDEVWRARRERQKAEREAFEREKKKKIADKKLEEASQLAYTDEILTAQGLIRHFNPNYDFASLGLDDNKRTAGGAFRAEVGRTVDESGIKGMKVVKKDEEDYFVGTGGKKGKKGKKGGNASPAPAAEGKFNLSFGVIEDFAKVKVDQPMSQADVPAVVEKLAAKITEWKKNQAAKTQEVCYDLTFRVICILSNLLTKLNRTSRRPRKKLSVSRKNLSVLPTTLKRWPRPTPVSTVTFPPRQKPSRRRMVLTMPPMSSRKPPSRTPSKETNHLVSTDLTSLNKSKPTY